MHQLKALTWRALKLRARSPLITGLDICGPIVAILIYLVLKAVFGSGPSVADQRGIFRDFNTEPINPGRDLPRHICTKVLFYSSIPSSDTIQTLISQQCEIEISPTNSRDDLILKLRKSLSDRINYKKEGVDLNKHNSSATSCNNLNYQVGIVIGPENHQVELHLTDVHYNPIIYHPFTQSSAFNVFRFSHGDLNSGSYLLETCIKIAYQKSNLQLTRVNDFNITDRSSTYENMQWRIKAFPSVTSPQVTPVLFILFHLVGNLCNACATVTRASEDNESGFHHYIRSAGISAGTYWLSQLLVTIVHMMLQNMIIAILLAIPTSSVLFDPIYDTNITFRWSILLSYSFSLNTHAMFVGSLFDKTSSALLTTNLVGICYGIYPIIFVLEWNPYIFTSYSALRTIFLSNPVSNFEALIVVLYALDITLGRTLKWSELFIKLPKASIIRLSIGELWLLLIIQGIFWFLATILLDHIRYVSSSNPITIIISILDNLLCCNLRKPSPDNYNIEELLIKSKIPPSEFKSKTAQSKVNPNRVCCSVRNLSIVGPNTLRAKNKGNSWRLKPDELEKLKLEEKMATKSNQYLVNVNNSTPAPNRPNIIRNHESQRVEPIFLDDAILQHIVWHKSRVSLEDVNLDFRFNQVSFILGQTDTKDLFFSALLGLRKLSSGFVVLEDTKYTTNNIDLARPSIGYLGEKDMFLSELTIFENLQFFGSLRDSSYRTYESESLFVLSLLHLMRRRDKNPHELTSRSARKLALAVAAVGHTKLLLLVEPTLSLRWRPRCQVLNLLKKYKSIRSIIVDTSDIDEAVAFGDRIVLLRENQAYFDDVPDNLTRKLSCGHWLVFEPVKIGDGGSIPADNLAALESLTNEIFKHDKISQLDSSKRSVYQEIMRIGSQEAKETTGIDSKDNSQVKSKLVGSKQHEEDVHKTTVILKVKQSQNSTQALCMVLRMFSKNAVVHNFRLAGLTFESLEDVLVLQMSRAIYPDLPPDLLLSLQHRIQNVPSNRISVRQWSDTVQVPKVARPITGSSLITLIKDRLTSYPEIYITLSALILSLIIFTLALWQLRLSLKPQQPLTAIDHTVESGDTISLDDYSIVEKIYKNRMAIYIVGDNMIEFNKSLPEISKYISNKKLIGFADRNMNESDTSFVSRVVQESRDSISSIVFFDPERDEATIIFDSQLTHCMVAGMRTFSRYRIQTANQQQNGLVRVPNIGRFSFYQEWFEIPGGYINRHMFYGIGFGFAESIAIGSLVMAPIRHKSESTLTKPARVIYWFGMALFDMSLSLLLIVGYIIVIILFENTFSMPSALYMLLILMLYKLAAIPFAYLVSLASVSKLNGFLFVVLIYLTVSWSISINLRIFVETYLNRGSYIYIVADWIYLMFPISALIDSMVDINHINRINLLCNKVPAFTPTVNILPLQGPQTLGLTDKLMNKVDECLTKGKNGISTNVVHLEEFGILWDIFILLLVAIITWVFLMFAERVFIVLSKRLDITNTSNDPLKTIVRSNETGTSIFRWNKEKDRLVSEYIRCLNEVKYVKQMSSNCIYLRIWLKLLSDQSPIEKRIAVILEPLFDLGQPKNEVFVELKTTLQLFIRLGSESSRSKVDKVNLIETYSKFVKDHQDTVSKFAVVDWSRESLYKVLLHGHYNTKSISAVT